MLFQRSFKKVLKIFAMFLSVCMLSGCGKAQVVLTTGFEKDEVFVVGSEKCTLPELNIYLTNIQKTYENVYGDKIWDVESDGQTLEESVKNTSLAQLAQVKTMYLLAGDRQLFLSGAEADKAKAAANEYFSSLSPHEVDALGASEELIRNMYIEMALARKAYEDIIRDISPEISDDEARFVKVRIIYMRTSYKNGTSLIPFEDSDRDRVYETLRGIRNGITSGEMDFETEAARYNEAAESVISFGKGTMDPAIEEAAFSLAVGETSEIVETSGGMYLMQCISTLDRTQTDANKILITDRLKDEEFEAIYNEYLENLVRNLNTELWKSVELNDDPQVTTSTFFETYEKYFGDDEL